MRSICGPADLIIDLQKKKCVKYEQEMDVYHLSYFKVQKDKMLDM
jgi:hypothetical protein